jgi:Zn-dependent peptidase ImmA (M78 family)
MNLVSTFVKFVIQELDLPSLPRSIKFANADYASQHLSFGTYNPATDEITISNENRHPVDVLRTLAHELVHHWQRINGKTLDGTDGSDIENEANALAGQLMRKFRTIRPDMFAAPQIKVDKIKTLVRIARTGVPQRIDEHYVDKFNAKLILHTARQLSVPNKKKFMAESVPAMIYIARQLLTQ